MCSQRSVGKGRGARIVGNGVLVLAVVSAVVIAVVIAVVFADVSCVVNKHRSTKLSDTKVNRKPT